MASATEIEVAKELKTKGNKAFAEHDWPTAIDFYTQAIDKNDSEPSFYCNRAQVGCVLPSRRQKMLTQWKANIRLEAYGYAIADATKAIELDKSYIKVHLQYCLGSGQLVLTNSGVLAASSCKYCHPTLLRRSERFQDRRPEGAQR